jgi:outer membrane receptor protein involved in Fe transport
MCKRYPCTQSKAFAAARGVFGGDWIWPAVTQFNLHLAYDILPKGDSAALQVYLNIDNLLDKDPPLAWSSISNYDPIGRYFRLGLRRRTD